MSVIETYPQVIGYDPEVYLYFKEQYVSHLTPVWLFVINPLCRAHLCGLDINLTYPQNGLIPSLNLPVPGSESNVASRTKSPKPAFFKRALLADINQRLAGGLVEREVDEGRLARRDAWKRDLFRRPNGTIDPWYGCQLQAEMVDYALNFSFPWSKCPLTMFSQH